MIDDGTVDWCALSLAKQERALGVKMRVDAIKDRKPRFRP